MRIRFFTACLLACAFGVNAETAVVDLAAAVFNSNAAKALQEQYKSTEDYVSLEKKYESTLADLERLSAHAESNSSSWDQYQLSNFQQKIEVLQGDLKKTSDSLDSYIHFHKKAIFEELKPLAKAELTKLIKERALTLLLNAESVVYIDPALSITDELTKKMNESRP